MTAPNAVGTLSPQCTKNSCLLDKPQGEKSPLKDNDFSGPVSRGFLYMPEASTLTTSAWTDPTIQHPGWGGKDVGFLPFLVCVERRTDHSTAD
jgi:hypothetical protein